MNKKKRKKNKKERRNVMEKERGEGWRSEDAR